MRRAILAIAILAALIVPAEAPAEVFGYQVAGTQNVSLNSIIVGAVFEATSGGTLDSITWCTAGTIGTPILTKCLIYKRTDSSLVACTDTFRVPASTPNATWISRPISGTITAGHYFLCAQAGGSIQIKCEAIVAEAQSDTLHKDPNALENAACVDPVAFNTASRQVNRRPGIYVTYTLPPRNMGQIIPIRQ